MLMKKSEFALYNGTGMAEDALSHILLLCVTDLSSPEPKGTQTSTPNNGLTAPPLVDVLQLKQRESQEGTESGDGVEEKIVYL